VDQYLNNRQHEILWKLLANPADNGHSYAGNLQSLVNDFPQSGLLQAMLARADKEHDKGHAAAYFNPKTLYRVINSADILPTVSSEKIVQELDGKYAGLEDDQVYPETEGFGLNDFGNNEYVEHRFSVEHDPVIDEESNTIVTVVAEDERSEVDSIENIMAGIEQVPAENIIEQADGVAEQPEPMTAEDILIDPMEQVEPAALIETPTDEHEPVTPTSAKEDSEDVEPITITAENEHFYEDELVTEAGASEQDQPGEIIELTANEPESVIEENQEEPIQIIEESEHEQELITDISFEQVEKPEDIDDDIFDEIVGIDDISFTPISKPVEDGPQAEGVFHEELPVDEVTNKDRALNLDDEAEKLIVGNIAATDYFAFDRAVGERKQAEADTPAPANVLHEAPATGIIPAEKQDVSKYHDEKMPYTFMWWLDKTRREHAGIYQPFKLDTSQTIRQSGAQELQQQYYENIFHLNSVDDLTRNQTIEFDTKTKEDRIIKKFIVEEPHISAPSSDKLDNENKAKKSAEDQDELVTETLARVYSDQMLYHKAINTYKKLMLKFPEKSRYFADQIELLERKTN